MLQFVVQITCQTSSGIRSACMVCLQSEGCVWSGKCSETSDKVLSLHHLNYTQRLIKLNMPTLKYRHHREDMIEVFITLQGINGKDITDGILHLTQNDRTQGSFVKADHAVIKVEINKEQSFWLAGGSTCVDPGCRTKHSRSCKGSSGQGNKATIRNVTV